MTESLSEQEYRMLEDLRRRFAENGAEKQAEFCGKILDGLDGGSDD